MAARRNSFVPFALRSKRQTLRTVRWVMGRGESLFWATQPVHFSVQEMLANPVMGVVRKGNNRFANRYKHRPVHSN